MKRLMMLIEVENTEQQQMFYDVLQEMIEDRSLCGYFTLVDHGEGIDDLPDYMDYETKQLIPLIAAFEQEFINTNKPMDNKHGSIHDDNL
jgi:hypothetical protein